MIPYTHRAARVVCAGRRRGLSRIDVLVLVTVVFLLGLVGWPALAQPRLRSLQAVCVGNLARMGQAFLSWGSDHSQGVPWRIPLAEGGSQYNSKVGNAWLEFSFLSNHLASPRFFACPADEETRLTARDFSNRPDGGLLHFGFRANAVSYFAGLDTFPNYPKAWLAGDRNIRVDGINQGCSSGVNNAATIWARPVNPTLGWTNGVHEFQGNMLHYDGHVAQYGSEDLRIVVNKADDNGSFHLLMPR